MLWYAAVSCISKNRAISGTVPTNTHRSLSLVSYRAYVFIALTSATASHCRSQLAPESCQVALQVSFAHRRHRVGYLLFGGQDGRLELRGGHQRSPPIRSINSTTATNTTASSAGIIGHRSNPALAHNVCKPNLHQTDVLFRHI